MSIGIEILNLLKQEITEIEYTKYIKNLTFDTKKSSSSQAIFYAPNILIRNWIRKKYSEKISHLFEIKTNNKIKVNIFLKEENIQKKQMKKTDEKRVKHSYLNPSHSFDNFMVGGSNQFAYSATKSVSEKFGKTYNPLFIYGGVGLGKTHLMHSAGNILHNNGKNVLYISAEAFMNEFLRHISNHTMNKFKEKYRHCDALLIDDIQFLSNKNAIQEEFFHTFEALRNDNKQIILTADVHPKKIGGLEERLQSRFEWGLVADIHPPELETKIAIINNKCQINKIYLTQNIINHIATVISNVREIEGILSKLNAYSQLINIDIDLNFAKNILKEHIQENNADITLDIITKKVSKDLNIKPSEIKSKGRSRNIVYARRIAIFISRELTSNTMPQLAQYFGMKDHTAISHTIKKINELKENDEDFNMKIKELINKIISAT